MHVRVEQNRDYGSIAFDDNKEYQKNLNPSLFFHETADITLVRHIAPEASLLPMCLLPGQQLQAVDGSEFSALI